MPPLTARTGVETAAGRRDRVGGAHQHPGAARAVGAPAVQGISRLFYCTILHVGPGIHLDDRGWLFGVGA